MKDGIHAGVSMRDYLADPCESPSLSSSIVNDLIARSPAHAWLNHPKLGGSANQATRPADIGTVAHALLFGGGEAIDVVDAADWRTKVAREQRAASEAAGRISVLSKDHGTAEQMMYIAVKYLARFGLLIDGYAEPTIVFHAGDVLCRCRPDWVASDQSAVIHYKTTEASARPQDFARGIMTRSGYDNAVAFYRIGIRAAFQHDNTRHLILVQEQEPPYACSMIVLSSMLMALATDRVMRAVAKWGACLTSGEWPGYEYAPYVADAMPWQLAENERQMQQEDDK